MSDLSCPEEKENGSFPYLRMLVYQALRISVPVARILLKEVENTAGESERSENQGNAGSVLNDSHSCLELGCRGGVHDPWQRMGRFPETGEWGRRMELEQF